LVSAHAPDWRGFLALTAAWTSAILIGAELGLVERPVGLEVGGAVVGHPGMACQPGAAVGQPYGPLVVLHLGLVRGWIRIKVLIVLKVVLHRFVVKVE